jgi:hypothetical protein
MSAAPKYFMYFPGNYRWSAAFVNMLGTAPNGGVDMSELHQIGRMLEGKTGDDDEAWFGACASVADAVRGRANKFRDENHAVAASQFYLRACHYYQMGERFRTPKDTRALDAYRTSVECFHQFIALSGSTIEIVDVPFEGKMLPGYFVPCAEREIRQSAVRGVLRWPRRHQGDSIFARRARSCSPRHFRTGNGRSRHRRGDPLPRHAAAPRL